MNNKFNIKYKNNTCMYVAVVITGTNEYVNENNIFCSLDKTTVETWVNRLNKIIKDNTERIKKYYNYTKEPPYWYDYINYENPIAILREIPIR